MSASSRRNFLAAGLALPAAASATRPCSNVPSASAGARTILPGMPTPSSTAGFNGTIRPRSLHSARGAENAKLWHNLFSFQVGAEVLLPFLPNHREREKEFRQCKLVKSAVHTCRGMVNNLLRRI